jgi:hypothetical protein
LGDGVVATKHTLARAAKVELQNIAHPSSDFVGGELEWIRFIISSLAQNLDNGARSVPRKGDGNENRGLEGHHLIKSECKNRGAPHSCEMKSREGKKNWKRKK